MAFQVKVDTSKLKLTKRKFEFINIVLDGELTAEELVVIGERTLVLARETIPFKTGAARDSLQMVVDPEGKRVSIGSDGGVGPDGKRRIYLRYLELGTSRMVARPFLLPSVLQAINEFKDRLPLKVKEMARISI